MRDDVEGGGAGTGSAADAVEHDDVAVLRDRRVGEHLPEAVARQRDRAADRDRQQADREQAVGDRLRHLQQLVGAADHEHAGGDHRGRVEVGRDRCRRRHRPRQPEVQRHLRRLDQRGDRYQRGGDGRRRARGALGVERARQLGDREGAVVGVEDRGADQHRDGADAGHQQRHQRRHARGALLAVEADQEVRADGGQVEQDEQQHEVLRRRQPDHREAEEAHPRPEAPAVARGAALVVEVERQVGGRVREDGRADAGRQQGVERADPVEAEVQPQVELLRPRFVHREAAVLPEDQARDEAGEREQRDGPGERVALGMGRWMGWRRHRPGEPTPVSGRCLWRGDARCGRANPARCARARAGGGRGGRRAGASATGGRYAPRRIVLTSALVSLTRSSGASSISSPRRPAETKIVANASALSSSSVGSGRRWPSGEIPPAT